MANKKVVITGGSGFIGTHLARALLNIGGYDITIVDLIRPRVENVKFIQAQLGELAKIKPCLNDADVVVHLAAMVGVDNCRNHPEEVRRVNSAETKQLIDYCASHGVKRFVFSSSSEVYGNSKIIPYREEAVPEPISLYAQCKLEIEQYLRRHAEKMSVGIVRFFNIYGPGQRDSFVVSIFLKSAIANHPIVIFGDGNQTRCFTYVADAVDGVIRLMNYNRSAYEIINIGNATEISVNELSNLVLKIVPGTQSVVTHQGYDGGVVREASLEIDRRVPAVEKAKQLLHFEAQTDLITGLQQTLQVYETTRPRQPISANYSG